MKRKGGRPVFTGEYMASIGYFAGANGEEGFVSYFSKALEGVGRVYILKGGCGCGKSALMKSVAAEARHRGEEVERIYCASDPKSLDGVILRGRGVAVMDGTAPHELSPRLPGAADTIINLGDYWDAGALRRRLGEISRLTAEKEAWQRRASGLLKAAGALRAEEDAMLEKAVLADKLKAAAGRTVQKMGRGGKGKVSVRLRRSFCAQGYVTAEDYGEKRLVPLKDPHGIGHRFLAALRDAALAAGFSLILSPDPLCKGRLDGVLIEETGTLYAVGEGEHPINTERFIHKAALSTLRPRLRLTARLIKSLEEEARQALGESRNRHSRLEDIYTPTMHFGAVDKRTAALMKEIFA